MFLKSVSAFDCRTDKGRCLRRVAHPLGSDWALVEFSDGYVYKVQPVYDVDISGYLAVFEKPGCYWNQVIRKRPRYSAQRLDRWPGIEPAGWSVVSWVQTGTAVYRLT